MKTLVDLVLTPKDVEFKDTPTGAQMWFMDSNVSIIVQLPPKVLRSLLKQVEEQGFADA